MEMNIIAYCPRCERHRLRTDFFKSKSGNGGRSTYCKPCAAEYRKHLRAAGPARKFTELGILKYCPVCKLIKEAKKHFYWHRELKRKTPNRAGNRDRAGPGGYCIACCAEKVKELRKEVIAAYGDRCKCCGETKWEFLTIDHIKGDGAEHRKALKSERSFYFDLQKQGYPQDGFQCLCYNCNCAKGHLGYCPHQALAV